MCEEIGLWGTAHSDGTVELRLLPTGAPDERFTLELEPGKPVPSLNIPQFRAPFCVRPPLKHALPAVLCHQSHAVSPLLHLTLTSKGN